MKCPFFLLHVIAEDSSMKQHFTSAESWRRRQACFLPSLSSLSCPIYWRLKRKFLLYKRTSWEQWRSWLWKRRDFRNNRNTCNLIHHLSAVQRRALKWYMTAAAILFSDCGNLRAFFMPQNIILCISREFFKWQWKVVKPPVSVSKIYGPFLDAL